MLHNDLNLTNTLISIQCTLTLECHVLVKCCLHLFVLDHVLPVQCLNLHLNLYDVNIQIIKGTL